jgi:hypothetical protein
MKNFIKVVGKIKSKDKKVVHYDSKMRSLVFDNADTLIELKLEKGLNCASFTIDFDILKSINLNDGDACTIESDTLNVNGYKLLISGMEKQVEVIGECDHIAQVEFISKDEVKNLYTICKSKDIKYNPAIAGIHLDNNYAVATDSFRMLAKGIRSTIKRGEQTTIPNEFINLFISVYKNDNLKVDILKTENRGVIVLYELDNLKITSRTINLDFPDYSSILNYTHRVDKEIEINRVDMLNVLKEILPVVKSNKENPNLVVIEFNKNELLFIGTNLHIVKEIKLKSRTDIHNVANDAPEKSIHKLALNTQYLIDALNSFDTTSINIKFNNNSSAVYINDLYLTMPLRFRDQ